jgi:hypothetical protein
LDLSKAFESLRTTRLKRNPEKCMFGVPVGKLLGFLVSSLGIKVNPKKVGAIDCMQPQPIWKRLIASWGAWRLSDGSFLSSGREAFHS